MVMVKAQQLGGGALDALARDVARGARIRAEDVLRLRRSIYSEGGIDRTEAEQLFQLNREIKEADPAWAEFFVEGLTDFFFWREGTDSSLNEDAEQMLIDWIGPGPAVDDITELRLLLNIMFRTNGSSERFRRYVLDAVRHSVLHSDLALFGKAERVPGAIDTADVEVIRKLIYGMGSQNGMAISQTEAEFLFELNRTTAGADNVPAWRDLFVKAITMYLLFGGPSPDLIDQPEAEWLLGQMRADQANDANERALLTYLQQEATSLHPALMPLCQRFGL